jgi:ADP-heptose:LPS heptosyltransferase
MCRVARAVPLSMLALRLCVSAAGFSFLPSVLPPSRMYFRIKRLEQAWNRFFIRTLGTLMPAAPLESPDWDARPHRILYLRHDKIGDMILSTSLIDAIAKSHPTITLDVLASPSNAPVLAGNPHVSSIILWEKIHPTGYPRLWRELRSRHYDAVVDCMVLSPSTTTLLLMLASGARHRIGIGGRINDYALTIRVPPAQSPVHHIDHSAVLVKAFGVNPDKVDWRPKIYFSDDELSQANRAWEESSAATDRSSMRRLLLNISAGQSPRRWPDDRYIAVIQHVKQRAPEVDVLVIAAPWDSERAIRIANAGGVRYLATAKLRDALALVASADLVVTPDTSIAHAASACRKPAVVLVKKGNEALWGAYGIPGRQVVNDGKTLATLPLAPVIAAVDELLAEVDVAQ